ncbi:MAG: Gfo/Idh/MocA family oxidoreductase [Clostridia bacterium]|nr:Gfo/Idh/MocA family oxidoreductase [Clostridia bacterium]
MSEKKIRVGVVGVGARGTALTKAILCKTEDVQIEYICDSYADRAEAVASEVERLCGYKPKATQEYEDILRDEAVEVVLIYAAWEVHIPYAIRAMKAGKMVGLEVGGAYSVKDCWELVDTYEETGVPVMMLENCCYGEHELMVLNMVRQGLFGELVYCEGGYRHDLREEVCHGVEKRHYRLRNYKVRNCDNYPTHALGPIAKALDINRGNRMLSLCSVSTKSAGLNEYAKANMPDNKEIIETKFMQGDVVTTLIRCARGEVIRLTLDTSLPRYYSRDFSIQGTKASYSEQGRALFLEGESKETWNPEEVLNTAKNFEERYLSPTWKSYKNNTIGGHGGMDWLVHQGFFDCIRKGIKEMPIDVYDTASWMVISALSEASIANGGVFVEIPDFTRGKWISRPIYDVEKFDI